MSVQDQAPRGTHPFAGVARAIDRAIPNPLLALPLLLLALGLLFEAAGRITGDTWFDLVSGRDIVQHGLPHSDRLMAFTAGHPWQDQQWLAHLASYGFYAVGGLPLVYLADCVLLDGRPVHRDLRLPQPRRHADVDRRTGDAGAADPGPLDGPRAVVRDAALRAAPLAPRA